MERTAVFGELAIEFAKSLSRSPITNSLIDQFIRAATGVGANYSEADCAESRRDYEHKVGISKKEARETMHWLRMIVKAVPEARDDARRLWAEARELYLIFSTIVKNSRAGRDIGNKSV